jgi:hypothetical protein
MDVGDKSLTTKNKTFDIINNNNKALKKDIQALRANINDANDKDVKAVNTYVEKKVKAFTEIPKSVMKFGKNLKNLQLPTDVGSRFKNNYRSQLVTSCICAAFLLIISINVMIESTARTNNTILTYIMCGSALFLSLIGLFLLPLIDTTINKAFTYMLIILGVLIVAIAAIGLILVESETDNPVTLKAGLGVAGIGLVACVAVPVLTFFNAASTAGAAKKLADNLVTDKTVEPDAAIPLQLSLPDNDTAVSGNDTSQKENSYEFDSI